EVQWSQVAGWALSFNDRTWWLLNAEGKPLLSLDWHLLPSEQTKEARAFVWKQLLTFLPSAKWVQPNLWQRWRISGSILSLLAIGSLLVWHGNRQTEAIALGAALTFLGCILFGLIHSFRVPSRALFIVHGDWLSSPNEGTCIHLPTIKEAALQSYGMHIVAADNQQIIVPKDFEWLVEYVKERAHRTS
ncbi:MAG: hypothetical protein RMK89_14050, partial [Armatimonadota bacterium]|nr:hypothetical protein [Armatimonadota bacterium]MDW8144568.1 hypothetical protein [Armatimonadota bacterium]